MMRRNSVGAAYEIAQELLGLAEQRQDIAARAVGHRCIAATSMFRGKLLSALAHFEQALALYEAADRHAPVFLSLSDLRVACLNFIPLLLLWQGYPDQATQRSRTAVAEAHALGHAFSLSPGMHLNCWLHQVLGDLRTVEARAGGMMQMTAEHSFPLRLANAMVFHGWALARLGEVDTGVMQMRDGIATRETGGMLFQQPYFLSMLADVYIRTGSSTEALPLLTEALAIIPRTEERWFEAEVYHLRGEALLESPERDEADAEVHFRRAIAVADAQGVNFWKLRAATSLARHWRDQGKYAEARDLLAPVYGWFSEGFDTPDLKEAKTLLEELSGP